MPKQLASLKENMNKINKKKKEFEKLMANGYHGRMYNYQEDKDAIWSFFSKAIKEAREEERERIKRELGKKMNSHHLLPYEPCAYAGDILDTLTQKPKGKEGR